MQVYLCSVNILYYQKAVDKTSSQIFKYCLVKWHVLPLFSVVRFYFYNMVLAKTIAMYEDSLELLVLPVYNRRDSNEKPGFQCSGCNH